MQPEGDISVQLLRARRTAAVARVSLGLCGVALAALDPSLCAHPALAAIGFAMILLTGLIQGLLPSALWLKIEESFALPAVLIVGLGDERVNVLALLWLAAVASGVLARGGRVHWIGRAIVLGSLAMPVALQQRLTPQHAAFCAATIALLLTCGRVTQELRALIARARYDADHDGLTGALARAAFRAQLDAIAPRIGPPASAALIVLDLDNFGQVNKSNGHAAGDALLASVVRRLGERAGADAIVGRLGGDEFAAVVHNRDPEPIARALMADLLSPADGRIAIGSSIGIARIPEDARDAETLLRSADVALRVAKRSGKQQLAFYAGESLSDEGPGGARATLRRLIAGEGLSIVVQPVVDLATGLPHGFEALARFPAGGPLHWLALADEFDLRAELELACLRTALTLLEQRPAGTELSVNLSGPLLLDPRMKQVLCAQPSLDGLVLELTENSLVEDSAELHAAVTELLDAGVQLAIDDMGAGYSGLRQITTIHARYLKLDRSMITHVDRDPGRCALITALLGYARQTDALLVAEGVETAAELATLKRLGVPLVQGFYLARPAAPWPEIDPSRVTGEAPAGQPGQLTLVRAI